MEFKWSKADREKVFLADIGTANKAYIGYDEVKNRIKNEWNKQSTYAMLEPEADNVLNKVKNKLTAKIAEQMTTQLAAETIVDIFQNMSMTLREGKMGTDIGDEFSTASRISHNMGYFLEKGLFGYERDNDPGPDVTGLAELKHSEWGKGKLHVGDITLYSEEGVSAEEQKERNLIMVAYKVYSKMKHLLLFRTSYESIDLSSGTDRTRHIDIEELRLFTDLVFERLWDELYAKIYNNLRSSITFGTGKAKSKWMDLPDTKANSEGMYPQSGAIKGWVTKYSISFDMKKVGGEYKWQKLYLRNIDMIDEIKRSDAIRAKFFGLIRHHPELAKIKHYFVS